VTNICKGVNRTRVVAAKRHNIKIIVFIEVIEMLFKCKKLSKDYAKRHVHVKASWPTIEVTEFIYFSVALLCEIAEITAV